MYSNYTRESSISCSTLVDRNVRPNFDAGSDESTTTSTLLRGPLPDAPYFRRSARLHQCSSGAAAMKTSRYASSRQKACHQCSNAKSRCDRKAGRCARCSQRGLSCAYPESSLSLGDATQHSNFIGEGGFSTPFSASDGDGLLRGQAGELPARRTLEGTNLEPTQSMMMMDSSRANSSPASVAAAHVSKNSGSNTAPFAARGLQFLDFLGLELVCPINVDDIQNRWLNVYIPATESKVKNYPPSVTAFIYRILKSYAAVAVRGRAIVPFVHSSQVMTPSAGSPLSTCLSLVRMCEKPLQGSEGVVADVLQREMSLLYEQQGNYDDMALLAAFQAYLIYSFVLYFRLSQSQSTFLRQAMMNLQELACSSSRRGLVCAAEQQHARPRWESWIVAEAKRRTLFTMYLFDSILSTQDGLPTFLGTELDRLPASSNKALWQAKTRGEWETAYNIHLAEWMEEGLSIDELWPTPADLDQIGLAKRRSRVDHWLENVDEFGTMLYAVTSCTHGG